MANSTKTSRDIRLNSETHPSRFNRPSAGRSASIVDIIAGYKSGDRKIHAGQDVFSLGEHCNAIYSIVEGWGFRYALLVDGSRQIFDFVFPGALLGYHSEARTTFAAQALTDCVVCVIPQAAFASLLRHHPEVGLQFASLIARDCSLAFAHLTNIGRRTARERVANLLLELFVRCRAEWPGHRIEEMTLPVTQEHIGDATGLTGVHVNRVLGDLSRDGILKFSYRRLSILDPDRLMDLAAIDPELLQSWTGNALHEGSVYSKIDRTVARGEGISTHHSA